MIDSILQLEKVLQEIKDKNIKLLSRNRDDYDWKIKSYRNSNSYCTYEQFNSDKINDYEDVEYSLNKKMYVYLNNSQPEAIGIIAFIRKVFNKTWEIEIHIEFGSYNTSPIEFKTRDEAAEAVQKWFDTYIFDNKDDNDELSQNNNLLDQIYDILK